MPAKSAMLGLSPSSLIHAVRPFALLLGSLMAWPAAAQMPDSLQTVGQAIVAKQPDQEAVSQWQALSQGYEQAGRSWFASGINFTLRHENDTLTDNTGFKSWESGLDVDLAGDLSRAYAQLGDTAKQQAESYAALLQWQAAALTRERVWALKAAEVQWQRLQQNQGLMAALHEKIQAAANSGNVPQMDAVLVQKERLLAEKQTLAAYNAYQQALSAYQFWSGFSQLPAQIEETPPNEQAGLEALLQQHPQWRWGEQQVQRSLAEQALALGEANAKTNLFVGAKAEEDNATAARTSLIVQVRVPLGQSAGYQVTAQQQQQAVSAQQIALQQTRQQLLADARLAQQAWHQAQALLAVAERHQTVSAQALSMAEQAYAAGETPIQTLLQVQAQQLQALLDYDLNRVAVGQALAAFRQALGLELAPQ